MDWVSGEEKPKQSNYYLCLIQGFSCNSYGNHTRYEVVYFNGKTFGRYPVREYYKGELMESEDVTWWMPLPPLPKKNDKK